MSSRTVSKTNPYPSCPLSLEVIVAEQDQDKRNFLYKKGSKCMTNSDLDPSYKLQLKCKGKGMIHHKPQECHREALQ